MKSWSDKKSFRSVVLSNESNSINYAKVVLADMGTQSLPGGSDTTYAYIFTRLLIQMAPSMFPTMLGTVRNP